MTGSPDKEDRARTALAEAINAVQEATGWTADDPDQLIEDIGEVLKWCRDIEAKDCAVRAALEGGE